MSCKNSDHLGELSSINDWFSSSSSSILLWISAPCLSSWCTFRNVRYGSIFLNISAFSGSFFVQYVEPEWPIKYSEKSWYPKSEIAVLTKRPKEWRVISHRLSLPPYRVPLPILSSVFAKELRNSTYKLTGLGLPLDRWTENTRSDSFILEVLYLVTALPFSE
jgi:hypothetical protein